MTNFSNFVRNEHGLFPHIEYKFLPDGRIDWRKMFLAEHLYLRRDRKAQIETACNKAIEDINPVTDNVPDEFLLSTLSGAKYLAWLRGYNSLEYHVDVAAPDYAVVTAKFYWTKNYESSTNSSSDVGHACLNSVTGDRLYQSYLPEIAANRAFVRAVRSFLGINVVSKEEVSESKFEKKDKPDNKLATLIRLELDKHKIKNPKTFIKDELQIDIGDCNKLEEVSSDVLVTILGELKNYVKK